MRVKKTIRLEEKRIGKKRWKEGGTKERRNEGCDDTARARTRSLIRRARRRRRTIHLVCLYHSKLCAIARVFCLSLSLSPLALWPSLSPSRYTPAAAVLTQLSMPDHAIYREFQLDLTPEIEVFHMVFDICHTTYRKRSFKQHTKYFNFQRKIQLDHPVGMKISLHVPDS